MVKKVIVALVVVVALGAGAYFLFGNKDEEKASTTAGSSSSQTQETATNNNQVSGNVYSLADGGSARKCTFDYSGSQGASTGTMYSDGSGRALMKVDVVASEGATGTSNTLVLADKVYGWMESENGSVGFVYDKAALTSDTSSTSDSSSSSTNTADPGKDFKLSCTSWTVDSAMLQVPADVKFTSLPGN